jgi:hypothetical protein
LYVDDGATLDYVDKSSFLKWSLVYNEDPRTTYVCF